VVVAASVVGGGTVDVGASDEVGAEVSLPPRRASSPQAEMTKTECSLQPDEREPEVWSFRHGAPCPHSQRTAPKSAPGPHPTPPAPRPNHKVRRCPGPPLAPGPMRAPHPGVPSVMHTPSGIG